MKTIRGYARCALSAGLWGAIEAGLAEAQPIGTFRWQLQPYCNRV